MGADRGLKQHSLVFVLESLRWYHLCSKATGEQSWNRKVDLQEGKRRA